MKTKTWVWVHPESSGATLIEAKNEREARSIARATLVKMYEEKPIPGWTKAQTKESISRHFEDAWFLPVAEWVPERRFSPWTQSKDDIADELVVRLEDWFDEWDNGDAWWEDWRRDVVKEQIVKRMSDEDAQWYVETVSEHILDAANSHQDINDWSHKWEDEMLLKCGFGR